MEPRIPIDYEKIKAFCEKWKITEFSLFGSVLTDEFRPDSDVDVMVTFEKDTHWTLLHIVEMEEELDEIARGTIDRLTVIRSFFAPFEIDLNNALENLQKIVITSEEKCPECGKPMVVKSSRYGKFLACSNYPECKGKKSNGAEAAPEVTNEPCPLCGKLMLMKKGRYGKFMACPDYPKCNGKKTLAGKGTWTKKTGDGPAAAAETTDEKCPTCGAEMVVRAGRFGKFLACSKYPKCKTTKKILRADKADKPTETETGKQ
jgi:DNA topoisomerase-1